MANKAAYLSAIGSKLEVKDAPLEKPGPNEVLIRNHAVAVNPLDIGQQDFGVLVEKWPYILGMDMAGVVEEVGENVTHLKKGDRVAAVSGKTRTQNPAMGAFQNYTISSHVVAAKIPEDTSFVDACMLPLAVATAAAGLFEPSYIGLPVPKAMEPSNAAAKEKAILIWSASSSVGGCAVQLAAACGLTVLATSSSKNLDLVKGLGADHVFDHTKEDVVKQIIEAASGKRVIGAYNAYSSPESVMKCAEVLHHFGGGYVNTVTPRSLEGVTLPDNVKCAVGWIPPPSTPDQTSIWNEVYLDFLENGLANGKLKAGTTPIVVGTGVEKLQEALERYRQGVSAAKVVVEL